MALKLDKLTVARRQLATAIELLFSGRDTVSVYSLATNSWEVIDVLCRRAGVESFSVQARKNVPQDKDLRLDYVNSPYRNFFKHAKSDWQETLPPLPESQVDGLVFMAVEDYIRFNQRSPTQFQVFQLWYIATNPSRLDPTVATEVLVGADEMFPGIIRMSRVQQLAEGARMLQRAATDAGVLADSRTEPAFD
ncbi:MAG: hypothetical protein E6Q78_13790 [Rhodoferax sp.]|nr:MAG: hypothetical protein E6Q78_13790 [Rhodoferax sp.]